MLSPEVYKSFGVIGFVFGWLAISSIFIGGNPDKSKSISHHAVRSKPSYVSTAILETIIFICKPLIY